MSSELSQMINQIMSEEMGELGPHIVRKQCKDIEVNPEDIRKEDLPRVAKVLSEVMVTFAVLPFSAIAVICPSKGIL